MNNAKRWTSVAGLIVCFIGARIAYGTFFGTAPTGLQTIASDQYGYTLYVPPDYTPDRGWPLVMTLHDEGELGEDFIHGWLEEAKKRGYLLFSPSYPVPREAPTQSDRWLLNRKHEIESQYEIDPARILVTGRGFGGHYAVYLGLKYPKEFSAVASVGNGIEGPFEKLYTFSYAKIHRLPVLIMKPAGETSADSTEAQAELDSMRSRGYSVEMVDVPASQELSVAAASPYVFDWFERVSGERKTELERKTPGVKEHFFKWVDDLLQNR